MSSESAAPSVPSVPPVPPKAKRATTRKPKAETTASAIEEEKTAPSKPAASKRAPKPPVSTCTVTVTSAKDGTTKVCGCKAKPPSTDRCGRHMAKEARDTSVGESTSGTAATKTKRQNKTKGKVHNMISNLSKVASKTDFPIAIPTNKFNNAIWPDSTIVIDQRLNAAICSQNEDGTTVPLSAEQIVFCRQHFIPIATMPHSIVSSSGTVEMKSNDDEKSVPMEDDEKGGKDDQESEEEDDEEANSEDEDETD